VYVNVDDCWAEVERDASGSLAADAKSFPSGMASLGAYLHERRLLFGIYSSAGTLTCAGRAASLGHEAADAAAFAAWDVDLLKYDNCHSQSIPPLRRYPPMRDALAASGRPILYAMCNWGVDEPGTGGGAAWGRDIANTCVHVRVHACARTCVRLTLTRVHLMHARGYPRAHSWRTSIDIGNFWLSILLNLEVTEPLWQAAGPGAWNDPGASQLAAMRLSGDGG
jgi:alpha-galactosidase